MAYDLYPAVNEDYEFAPEVREANALTPEFRNQVVPMTETQRNNLTGTELWTNRLIFNTTTVRINRYNGSAWVNLSDEPPGIIKMDAGATPPDNHLACNGAVIARDGVNAALFARIGTQYNTGGEASTHFRLPNLTGRVPVGIDAGDPNMNALGETGGAKTVTLTTSHMPSHSHGGATGNDSPDHGHFGGTDNQGDHAHYQYQNGNETPDLASGSGRARENYDAGGGRLTSGGGTHAHNVTVNGANARHAHGVNAEGGGAAVQNMPPYLTLNYIITL